jgi:serine/threonine-protein kinase
MIPRSVISQFDGFQLDEVLLWTKSTIVFRATDIQTGLTVAIKALRPGAEKEPERVFRFSREIQAVSRLDHPSIARILSCSNGKRFYIVREWVEGSSLANVIARERKLPFDRAVWLATALCVALQSAHTQGVSHCNLSPSNILLDSQDRIKIVNFENAAIVGEPASFPPEKGACVAPEVLKGKPGGPSSDIYSLGCILFEMLSGKAFGNWTRRYCLLRKRLGNSGGFKSTLDPRTVELITRTILKATDPDPVMRRQSMSDLALDLTCRAQDHRLTNTPSARPERLATKLAFLRWRRGLW